MLLCYYILGINSERGTKSSEGKVVNKKTVLVLKKYSFKYARGELSQGQSPEF